MNFCPTRICALFVAGCFFWSGLLVSLIHAEDIYVAQTALGGDTGASASNAHSLAWANTAANWGAGAGKVSAGDTVRLSGPFVSTLTIQGSGASGSPVTVLFEPGASFAAPFWSSGAIYGNGKNFITIDGGTNGRIEATANGTAKANQVGSIGVLFENSSNLTIRNLIVTNQYVRTPRSADGTREGQPIVISNPADNIIVENCTLSEGDTCLAIAYGTGSRSNVIVRNNTIGRCNHGITFGTNENGSNLDNVQIYGNRINDLDVWEGNSGLHLDGMIIFNEAPAKTGAISNLKIYNNRIGPNIGVTTTAGIFINVYTPQQSAGMQIYNNLFLTAAGHHWNNGAVCAIGNGAIIANNTFVSAGGDGLQIKSGFGTIIKNNLFYYVGTAVMSDGDINALDYNVYCFGPSGFEMYHPPGFYYNFGTWKSATGFDANSTTSQPALDGNYVPIAGDTVARGKGVNLSMYFKTDMNGNPRPSTGAWTIGAFESAGTSSAPAAPAASTPTPTPTPTPAATPNPTPAPTPTEASAPSGVNVALAANGGVASASSTLSSNYTVNGVNNGDRSGAGWAAGSGGWNDATQDIYPDWVEIAFSGPQNINEVDVFTLQDHPGAAPTESMTFGSHGITAFDVQYWNGSAWLNVPGGHITGNNLVWRKLTFAGTNTSKMRVVVNSALAGYSRIVEIEAYTASGAPTPVPMPTPAATPTSSLPGVNEPFAADSRPPTPPFAATDGYVSQPTGTSLTDGGLAVYEFTVPDHAEYAVIFEVDAANAGSNSLYINVDAEPQDPVMAWDIPVTTGFEARIASWRGGGTFDNNQFVPKYFLLSPGPHELIIRGREGNTKFKTITIVKRPAPPNDLVLP